MAGKTDKPPEFFIDRSLGKSIAVRLREVGWIVHTMAEVYGERAGQGLADVDWLNDAGIRGWIVLTKDDAIRRRPAELQAMIDASARVFCLTSAQLRGVEQAERFVVNHDRILRQAAQAGPYVFGVYADRIRRLWPPAD